MLNHLEEIINPLLDPLKVSYWASRLTNDVAAAGEAGKHLLLVHKNHQHWLLPGLFSLPTSLFFVQISSADLSVKLLKFTDKTIVICLIQDSDV